MSYYYVVSPRDEYLAHYGVKEKSGRYKWGTGDRPKQRLEQPKRKGFFATRKEKKRQASILEKKKQLLEEARKKDEEKAKFEADKERVLKEGNALEIQKYASELTNAELQAACDRIKWMNSLNTYANQEEKRASGKSTFDQIDDFMNKLGKVNKWGETSIKTYENTKKIMDYLSKAAQDAEKKSKGA